MKKRPKKKLFTIKRALVDKRLDNALVILLQEEKSTAKNVPSRSLLTRLIKEGGVTVNGKIVKPHYLLQLGDGVALSENLNSRPDQAPGFSGTTLLTLPVIFENDDFLVVDKPPHLLAHPTSMSQEETVAHFFSARYPEVKRVGDDPLRPGIVHRLDRETSGLMVLAKNQKTFLALKKLFQKRAVQKTYLALVYGHFKELAGKIDSSLTRKSGELKRSVVETGEETTRMRPALTEYRVIRRYHDYDLVAAFPKTGRTHQIRVHFSSTGHPVVGDKFYAFRSHKRGKKEKNLFPERHMLHAWRLEFTSAGEKFAFEAPLPRDFLNVLKDIDPALTFRKALDLPSE